MPVGAQGRQRFDDLAAEGLDPVHVVHGHVEQHAGHQVVDAGSKDLALLAVLPPAGYHVITLVQFLQQLGDVLFRVGFQIGRQEDDHVSLHMAKTGAQRGGQSLVAAMAHQAQERILAGQAGRQVTRAVGRAVVDQNELGAQPLGRQLSKGPARLL